MGFNISGSLAASGSAPAEGFRIGNPFYIDLSGTWVGSVALEALPDEDTAWVNCLLPDGSLSAFTTNGLIAVPNAFGEKVRYRLTFTRTSGTLLWRLFR